MSRLGQHDGDGIRYAMHLSAPKGGSAQMLRDPAGGWVSWEDYARLKAECQARQAENSVLAVECDSLKAEVERLTQLNDTLSLRYDATKSMLDGCAKEIEEMEEQVERLTTIIGADAIDREHGMCCDASAQVERLTKAGDAMAMAYAKECLDERGGVGSTIDNFYNNIEPIKVWNAAKKGGQP